MLVTNGVTVVATAEDGSYRLPISEERAVIYITRPAGYAPTGSFWQWSDGSAPADFGLVEEAQPEDFFFVQVTDSHVGRLDLFKEFAERINRFPIPLAFVINTGDLVGGVDVVAIDGDPRPGRGMYAVELAAHLPIDVKPRPSPATRGNPFPFMID